MGLVLIQSPVDCNSYELCAIWYSGCVSESYIRKQFSTQWLKEREKYRRSKRTVILPLSNCLEYYHISYTAVARPIKRQPLIIYRCPKSRKHKTKLYILMNKNKTNISFTLWKGEKKTLLPFEASDERPSPVRQWERQSHSQFMVASQMKTAKSRKGLSSHKLDSMPSDPLLPASNQRLHVYPHFQSKLCLSFEDHYRIITYSVKICKIALVWFYVHKQTNKEINKQIDKQNHRFIKKW